MLCLYTHFIDQIYTAVVNNLTLTMLRLRCSVLSTRCFVMDINSLSESVIILSCNSLISGDREAIGLWESFVM
jgi:hypothetical protein